MIHTDIRCGYCGNTSVEHEVTSDGWTCGECGQGFIPTDAIGYGLLGYLHGYYDTKAQLGGQDVQTECPVDPDSDFGFAWGDGWQEGNEDAITDYEERDADAESY